MIMLSVNNGYVHISCSFSYKIPHRVMVSLNAEVFHRSNACSQTVIRFCFIANNIVQSLFGSSLSRAWLKFLTYAQFNNR